MPLELVKISEPTIMLKQTREPETGELVEGAPQVYIAISTVTFFPCRCEHRVQAQLDLEQLADELGERNLNEGRIKQALIADIRRTCRTVGCPSCNQGMMVVN